MRRTAVLIVLTLVGALLAALPAGAARAAGPQLTVTGPDPQLPRRVLPQHSSDYETRIGFRVTGTDLTSDVTVTASGPGITADPPARTVAPGGFAGFDLVATPGLHRMTVTFTAEGADPVTREYWIWAAGGDPIAASGSLAGRRWMWHGPYHADDRPFEWEDTVWFLDDEWAVAGFPEHGVPETCEDVDRPLGCIRYSYDVTTGLVQVGNAIGVLRPHGLYLDGRGPGHSLDEDPWGHRVYQRRLGLYPGGTRLAGDWSWVSGDQIPNRHWIEERLRLQRDGQYTWRQVSEFGDAVVRTGRYTLGSRGALALQGAWGRRDLTFMPCLSASGERAPDRCLALGFHDPDEGWAGAILTRTGR